MLTIACQECGRDFAAERRSARYCGPACRQLAYRARRAVAQVPERRPRAGTVYECPECSSRYLGEQRCADCGTFCRSLGPGGECPCCGEPVAVRDLLTD